MFWLNPRENPILSRWHCFTEEGPSLCGFIRVRPEKARNIKKYRWPLRESFGSKVLIWLGLRKPVVCPNCYRAWKHRSKGPW